MGKRPSHRQVQTQRTVVEFGFHDQPLQTVLSSEISVWPWTQAVSGGARKRMGRMCRMRLTSCLQNINYSQEGTPLLFNFFINRFNQQKVLVVVGFQLQYDASEYHRIPQSNEDRPRPTLNITGWCLSQGAWRWPLLCAIIPGLLWRRKNMSSAVRQHSRQI